MMAAAIDTGSAFELTTELFEEDLELYLGDGSTFADYLGDGVFVIDQVNSETQEGQSVALTLAAVEALLSSEGTTIDLGDPSTAGHYMGCDLFIVDQSPEDTPVAQRIVLTRAGLELLRAWSR